MRVRFPSTVESPCRTRPAPTRRRTRVEVERLERDEALEGNLLIRPGRLMIPRRGGPGSVAAARVLHAAGPPDAPVSVLNVEPRHDAHLGPVLEALEGLEETLEASAVTERALGEQVRQLRARRERGLSWRDATAGTDGTDGVLAVLGNVLNGLTEAGSVLRRVLAATLVEEGASTAEVAQRFGVSRQRVFRLLRGRDQEVSRGE